MVQIDKGNIYAQLDEVASSTVGETLNALLGAEADQLCRAQRYEGAEACDDTRVSSYERQLRNKGPALP